MKFSFRNEREREKERERESINHDNNEQIYALS